MHEGVIAQSIVNTVLKHVEQHAVKEVETVFLKIGQLAFLSSDQLLFWIKHGFEKTVAEKCEIKIDSIKSKIKCNSCGYEGELNVSDDSLFHYQTPIFNCPKCYQSSIDIIEGREMFVEKIKVKR